jgi:hypothetical protein
MTESMVTGRGAVCAFILISRLHTEAYALAFYHFFLENPSTWSIDDENQVIVLNFVMVVDHADSQRKGFIEAIRMLHALKILSTTWTEALAKTYIKHLQGCEFHFLASVKNTARNGSIIPAVKLNEFKGYCTEMLTAQTMDGFNSAASKIRAHFPKATTWLKWWVNPLHAVLLFPAYRSSLLHQDLQAFARNPKTTNLCESQHRNYYRSLKTLNLPVVLACIHAYHYCVQQVSDAQAVATGSRPLTTRDKGAIIRKTAIFARQMEFEGGLRPPTTTTEHNSKKPRATTPVQFAQPIQSSQVVVSDEADDIQMRLNIMTGNVTTPKQL